MHLDVYLAGEIHTGWREEIIAACRGLDIAFFAPVTDHDASDDVGAAILGPEERKFWHDHKSALINAIRIGKGLREADVVIVRFGEKYRQWNAAFDAGQAVALGKALIVIHPPEFSHALKEIDAAANAVCETPAQAAEILRYVLTGALPRN